MAKATARPLCVNFPKAHPICDCCDKVVSWSKMEAVRGELGTVAGGFKYQICRECVDEIEALPAEDQVIRYAYAAISHAELYSGAYANFIADWFGFKERGRGKKAA